MASSFVRKLFAISAFFGMLSCGSTELTEPGAGTDPDGVGGTSFTAVSGESVTFDGSRVFGEGAQDVTYQWTQLDNGAPNVDIPDSQASRITFVAPEVAVKTQVVIQLHAHQSGADVTVLYVLTVLPRGGGDPDPEPNPITAAVVYRLAGENQFSGSPADVVEVAHNTSLELSQGSFVMSLVANKPGEQRAVFAKDAMGNGAGGHLVVFVDGGARYRTPSKPIKRSMAEQWRKLDSSWTAGASRVDLWSFGRGALYRRRTC